MKKEYVNSWLSSDCPKPWDYATKREYKEAKKQYVDEKHNITDYLIRRYEYLKDIDRSMADLYLNFPEIKAYKAMKDMDEEYFAIISPILS